MRSGAGRPDLTELRIRPGAAVIQRKIGDASIGKCRNEKQVVAKPQIQSEARRDLPVVLEKSAERADHRIFAVLVAQRAARGPSEHELGESIAGVAAVLRVGREFTVEGELAACESRGVPVDIFVFEFKARL